MAHDIHKAETRAQLPARKHEPYWYTLDRGQAIGFRKIAGDKGYWIARRRPDEDSSKKYEYEPLGEVTDKYGWAKAKAAAEVWFKQRTEGVVTTDLVTVTDACKAYVAERRASKSEANAHDAEKRFERTVYSKPLGDQKLGKLTAEKVQEWRDGLKLSPGATNRTLTALKAALNLAVKRKKAAATLREDLRHVAALPGGNKRRELYLDLKQRRDLLKHAEPAVRDLIDAVTLTGARAGELVRATVSQFDARSKSMTFITGKQRDNGGRRDVPLTPVAFRLFKRLAGSKAPTAPLFVRGDGAPWSHSDWDGPIREAAKAAKLPSEPHTGVCLYTLRHCFITDAIDKGLSVLEVARYVGTSVQMIDKNYGKAVAKRTRERLAKVRLR